MQKEEHFKGYLVFQLKIHETHDASLAPRNTTQPSLCMKSSEIRDNGTIATFPRRAFWCYTLRGQRDHFIVGVVVDV